MIRALVGGNFYAKKAQLDKIVAEFQAQYGDFSLERIDGVDAEPRQIIAALDSVSLFMPTKMVVVEDLSKNKLAADKLDMILAAASEAAQLVLVDGEVDKRSSY